MPKRETVAPGPEAESALPWEQQPGESDKAFAHFVRYRDLPPEERSLRAVRTGRQTGKRAARIVEGWSSRHSWVERVRAYDRMMDRERVNAQRREVVAMAERHARQATALQGVAMRALTRLAARLEADPDAAGLQAETIRSYLLDGMKAERLARGEPETISRAELDYEADPAIAAMIDDPDVQEAARDLVRRAAEARDRQPRRTRPGDES